MYVYSVIHPFKACAPYWARDSTKWPISHRSLASFWEPMLTINQPADYSRKNKPIHQHAAQRTGQQTSQRCNIAVRSIAVHSLEPHRESTKQCCGDHMLIVERIPIIFNTNDSLLRLFSKRLPPILVFSFLRAAETKICWVLGCGIERMAHEVLEHTHTAVEYHDAQRVRELTISSKYV